jgi:group I intron endonuclease
MENYRVYIHTAPSGKRYVGITRQEPKERWKNGLGYPCNKHFTSAIQKYGWDNIAHEIVCEGLSYDEACKEEQRLVALYRSNESEFGYNKTSGGDANRAYNEEIRNVISEKQKLRYVNPEEREKASLRKLGKRPSAETRAKMSAAKLGTTHTTSKETRQKMSETHKTQYKNLPAEEKQRRGDRARASGMKTARRVSQFTTGGELVATYNSAHEAERKTGVRNGNISLCCNGKMKSSGGFKWQFAI